MAKAEEKHAPIRQSVRVDCPIEEAFRLFTEGFGEWWPLASYSITGEQAESCAMEPWAGGRVFERTRSGEEREWGSVTVWDAPRRVELTWHPGTRGDDRQTVDIEFSVEADGTRVTLTHSGWDAAGVQACALGANCAAQWPAVLELCFAEFVYQQMVVTA
jgi:uncharacterized protein YndB with AHSA1/START domain